MNKPAGIMMNFDFRDLIENIYDGLYLVDSDRKITFWNRAAERITGYGSGELMGRRCSDNILVHVDEQGQNLCLGMCPLAQTIQDGASRDGVVYLKHKQGHRLPVWVRVNPLRDPEGNIVGAAELFTDISEQQSTALRIEELEKLAYLDKLTQLANRHYIEAELESRFAEMNRYGLPFGILLMDIDHFKPVNDTHGHDIGDRVLKTVAKTILSNARPFDLFGRWGGDELIGIIRNVDISELLSIGNRCRVLAMSTQVNAADALLNITLSIGATLALPVETPGALIKRADKLLYKSKELGRNRITSDWDQ